MPCDKCKKKGIPMKCNYCPNSYCSRCIQLEMHSCEGIEQSKQKHISNLEKQLAFEPTKKVTSI